MRVLGIILALVMTAASLNAEDARWKKYGFSQFGNETLLPAASYRLTLLRVEPDKDHGSMGFFAFRHTLDKSLRMWGFGFETDGSLRTRFERFSKLEGHWWSEDSPLYCGTGAETFELQPNRDYILRVPLRPYRSSGDRGVVLLATSQYRILSEEFDGNTIRKKVANIQ